MNRSPTPDPLAVPLARDARRTRRPRQPRRPRAPRRAQRPRGPSRFAAAARLAGLLAGAAAALLAGGCATTSPKPLARGELAEAQTFPYFPLYWAGSRFGSYRLAGADGRKNYNPTIGDSVYYGDCVAGKSSALGESGCELPLQVTTVFYSPTLHGGLGPHRNALLRGVPAAIFDGGRSIQLYSGRLAIDVYSDTAAEALAAVARLRPVNAPGSAARPLPSPVYCPLLSGPQPARLQAAMQRLPRHACQRAALAASRNLALFGKR
jgi:hypothetical protein